MPRELTLQSDSPDESARLGAALGRSAQAGDLICLVGPLGAGKTTLIQGIAAGLEVADRVTSPSFTLIHEHRGRLPFYHVDLYRLSPAQAQDLGLEEYLAAEGVAAVEWAERLPLDACADGLVIQISFAPADTARHLVLSARGPRAQALLERLQRAVDSP
jgi:tRNA threonylcarbamoyladenosine biosynthesis protein TsaE